MKVYKSNLEGLLQRHVEMAAEIKNLDTDLQMLVYENYNKFISATDTIKRYVDTYVSYRRCVRCVSNTDTCDYISNNYCRVRVVFGVCVGAS